MSETQPHNQESATTLPGAILKRCREYHGITLSEAAETTKIGVNYLTALEEDKISEFASLAYLKGFLRIYANYLGLNPEDMLRIYERLYDPPVQTSTVTDEAEPVHKKGFRWHKLLLPVMLLLLMLIAATILNRQQAPELPPKVVSPVPSTPVAALPQVPIQPVISSVQQPPASPPKAESRPKLVKPPGEITKPEIPVRHIAPETPKSFIAGMKVIRNGSLSVIIDGAAPQHYELSIGDTVEWKAEKSIALELSNGGGVEVEVNGKPLAPLNSSGAPTYVVIDAEGIRK